MHSQLAECYVTVYNPTLQYVVVGWEYKLWQNKVDMLDVMHGDVITWKHSVHYWPFVRIIRWWPVDSPD